MTTVEPRDRDEPRTYAHFGVPRATGYGSLGLTASLLAAAGVTAALLALALLGLPAAAAVAATTGLGVLLLTLRDVHGLNLGTRLAERATHRRAKRSGTTGARTGPTSEHPTGRHPLPGIAAPLRLAAHPTPDGHPFVLVDNPTLGLVALAYRSEPDGDALLDETTVDQQVADYGGWLAGLAQEDDLVAASVIVETRGATGHRLHAEVDGHGGHGSPAARAVMADLAATLPAEGATVTAWATATFATGRRTLPDLARDLAPRVQPIAAGLSAAGLGAVAPATPTELCAMVRCAYDPAAADLIDAAAAAGDPLHLDWADAGPVATEEGWDWYAHDGGWSTSWTMTRPLGGEVTSRVLARLLAPHPAIDVKRVALLYRPWDLGRAVTVVETDKTRASAAVNNHRKALPEAGAEQALLDARVNAAAVARGAGVLDFALVITATVTDRARLAQARTTVDSLRKTARLLTRPAYGGQAAAFAYALPLGLVPARYAGLATRHREKM